MKAGKFSQGFCLVFYLKLVVRFIKASEAEDSLLNILYSTEVQCLRKFYIQQMTFIQHLVTQALSASEDKLQSRLNTSKRIERTAQAYGMSPVISASQVYIPSFQGPFKKQNRAFDELKTKEWLTQISAQGFTVV